MKNEEIDRVIAEHFGWEFIPCHDDGFGRATGETWRDPDGDIGPFPPSYSTDLNAMHEAEKKIVDWVFWRIQLSHVVGIGYAPDLDICEDIKSFASATAHQRAEAFLRTIGKWVE